MAWDAAFVATAGWAKPEQIETFRRNLDPAWIEAALAASGTATVRRRRLPVEEVVWIVLGMALFRDRPMEDIVSKLDLALPSNGDTVARSSVVQARQRLGQRADEVALRAERVGVGARKRGRASMARAGVVRHRREHAACARHVGESCALRRSGGSHGKRERLSRWRASSR